MPNINQLFLFKFREESRNGAAVNEIDATDWIVLIQIDIIQIVNDELITLFANLPRFNRPY